MKDSLKTAKYEIFLHIKAITELLDKLEEKEDNHSNKKIK